MHVRYVARSDAGMGRDGNEDSGIAGPALFAVADGMGGHAAGEVASQAAVIEFARAGQPPPTTEPLDLLTALFVAANDRIRQLAADSSDREGMGTTATVILATDTQLSARQVALGHIGDSRAYLLHDGALRQLTKDHTFVQTLVDDEQITPSEARNHPARSVVTKVLQGQQAVDPDLSMVDVDTGDRLLICSDGLTDVATDDVIAEVLRTAGTLDEAADALIQAALAGGGPDNVTVVLAEVTEDDMASSDGHTYLVGAATS